MSLNIGYFESSCGRHQKDLCNAKLWIIEALSGSMPKIASSVPRHPLVSVQCLLNRGHAEGFGIMLCIPAKRVAL